MWRRTTRSEHGAGWRGLARGLACGVIAIPVLVFCFGCPEAVQNLSSNCTSDTDCSERAICSSALEVCVASCRDVSDCSGDDLCNRTGDAESGECVECITALDCNPGEACSVSGHCGICTQHEECLPSEICYLNSCTDVTGDIAVNATTEGWQEQPAIAVDQFGEFIVVWEGGEENDWGIFGQRLASSGSLVDGEIEIASSTVRELSDPDVAREAAPGARFVVVWRDGPGSVVAQRFSAAGAAVGTPIVVTPPGLPVGDPAVAMNADGFVVVWSRLELGGDGWEIQGRLYDANGMPIDDEFPVNTTSAGRQDWADVAIDLEDHVVVVWQSEDQDGDGSGVYGQWFTAGAPVGAEFPVNTTTQGNQVWPTVAMDPDDGSFVVAWEGEGPGDEENVFAQLFFFGGSRDGSEFPVNTTPLIHLRSPEAAMAGGGAFAVTWDRWVLGGSYSDVFMQRFHSNGTPDGGEALVNVFTLDSQVLPVVAVDPQNTVIGVAWTSYAGDRSGFGVFAQVGPLPPVPATEIRPAAAQPTPSPLAGGGGFPYAAWPDPTVTLLPAAPGGSSEHELAVSVYPGELETYTARWGYAPEFGFAGFTAIGPIGSTVGGYSLDADFDGVPEVERPLVSLGDDTAYVDLDGDGDPIGNPLLIRGAGPGPQFYLVAPFGGDGNPATLTVPAEVRIAVDLMPGILLNPAEPGTYTVLIQLTSVDPDSDDMDDGAGLSPVIENGQIEVFLPASGLIFSDGFESGDTLAWTLSLP